MIKMKAIAKFDYAKKALVPGDRFEAETEGHAEFLVLDFKAERVIPRAPVVEQVRERAADVREAAPSAPPRRREPAPERTADARDQSQRRRNGEPVNG